MHTILKLALHLVIGFCICAQSVFAQATRTVPADDAQLAYAVYKELIEYQTTASEQNNTIADNALRISLPCCKIRFLRHHSID